MSFPMELHGPRVRAREWLPNEAEALHRWLGSPTVTRFLTWGTNSVSESEAHLCEIIDSQSQNPHQKYFLAVELRSHPGVSVGDAGFTWIEDRVAEFGYFLEPAYWGQGYATEAARLIIRAAFDLGAERIIASCSAQNSASEHVMKRCDMKLHESTADRLVYEIRRPG